MYPSRFTLVLHAGTAQTWTTNPVYQQKIEKILRDVATASGAELSSGAQALDVVQSIVTSLEDCPLFNAGHGSALNVVGGHELEAAIADGASGMFGAVACAQYIKNPVAAARAVLNKTGQSFLAGHAADDFARSSGVAMVTNDYFTTATKKAHWQDRINRAYEASDDVGTVGAVALDIHGNLAAAGSTGGLTGKMEGRIGDTAIIGAGLSVDKQIAVACSGVGEDILQHSVAGKIAALNGTGPLSEIVKQILLKKANTAPSACAVIAIDAEGHLTIQSGGRVFPTAFCTRNSIGASIIETSIPLLLQHTIYEDSVLAAGLTRYPNTPGHTVITCHGIEALFSSALPTFLKIMHITREISAIVASESQTYRCGLACNGGGTLSLIPLHGLSKDWNPVVHDEEEYHDSYPGYLTSKNGPMVVDSILDQIRSRVAAETGITEPFNQEFDGEASNTNLFARIIRGELPQWRIWEDNAHVAFLTPFGNTPGFTVIVPRKHLGCDILGLELGDYTNILKAAHTVAQHLKNAFAVKRCGILFEGYEIDYAHVELIPVHEQSTSKGYPFTVVAGAAKLQKSYEGYLTTQLGPIASDLDALSRTAEKMRSRIAQQCNIVAPKTWQHPSTHTLCALQSSWYTAVFAYQDTLFHVTTTFFHEQLKYKYTLAPVTTDSISSPMGLGSDSLPVHVTLHGVDTYLADSMQSTLEYTLRLEENLKGTYYVGCSFRGEDSDEMHLNQFYHAECELLGTMDDGITVAERYVTTLASAMLERHINTIRSIAGTTSHITDLLALAESNNGHFPRITLSQALSLPEIVSTHQTWQYVVSTDHSKGRALSRIGERLLIQRFGGAVWITEMDHLSVPFYQAFLPNSNKAKALCADLLFGPGEVLGLGQRHAHAEDVGKALDLHEVPRGNYKWYMDIRAEGMGGKCLQTTGWGMGMERFLAWIMKHDDIRDLAIIPRLKGMKFTP